MNKSILRVVELIQSHMAEGELVWHKPYISTYQANLVSNNEYHGVNRLTTALIGHKRGYTSPLWATFRQIATLGGTLVEAKSQGIPIIFYKDLTSSDDNQDEDGGDEKCKRRFVLRHSIVFNLDLVEGLEAVDQDPGQSHFDLHAESEDLVTDYIEREGVRLSVNPSSTPAYAPAIDTVYSPGIQQFYSQDEYYSTVFHELAHNAATLIMPHRML